MEVKKKKNCHYSQKKIIVNVEKNTQIFRINKNIQQSNEVAIRSIYTNFHNHVEFKMYITYNVAIQLLCNSPKETPINRTKGYIKDIRTSIYQQGNKQ